MGNSSGKESSPDSVQPHGRRRTSNASPASGPSGSATAGAATSILESGTSSDARPAFVGHSTGRRGSTHDFSFLGLGGGSSGGGGGSSDRDALTETRRETRAEKDARKLEKERATRVRERERSIKEEHVDGGFLVTMGTYTASEDFNKAVVRQLIIERRIAPFFRGLDDFSSSWTEHQLVAAARNLPIPAPDEIPAEFRDRSAQSSIENIKTLNPNGNTTAATPSQFTLPLHNSSNNADSNTADASSTYTSSHPAFSSSQQHSSSSPPTASPLFRGRAKTLASLTTFRNNSQSDMTPQEVQLPNDPYVNGQPIEVFLYKNATECPICFLYFPPYFNKSRCCDQPICSECFVQIKRPEPHQPENLNPDEESQTNAEDAMLVSEPAQCPFCTEPEFGVTYDPPPFRRGLTYVNQVSGSGNGNNKGSIASMKSATSSHSSIASHQAPGSQSAAAGVGRRRAVSLSANAPTVITTDRIRPDWAKKLADARAQTMRRSAAATALHNAAYLLNSGGGESRGFMLGRRRRAHFVGDGLGGGSGGDGGSTRAPDGMTPENMLALLSGASDRRAGGAGSGAGDGRVGIDSSGDLFPGRTSSRRTRVEELEEMMMMEAIRQSLQAEEDRKQKEDKETSKAVRKEEKKRAKEAKKAEKAAKKRGDRGGSGSSNKLYKSNTTSSSSFTNNSVHSGSYHQSAAANINSMSSSSFIGRDGDGSSRLEGMAFTSLDSLPPAGASESSGVVGTGIAVSGKMKEVNKKGKEPDRVGFAMSPWTDAAEGTSGSSTVPRDGPDRRKRDEREKEKKKKKSKAGAQSASSSISSSTLTSSGSSTSTKKSSSSLRSRSRSGSLSRSRSGSRSRSRLGPQSDMAMGAVVSQNVKLVPASSSRSASASASAFGPSADAASNSSGSGGGGGDGSGNDNQKSGELPLTGFQSLAAMIETGMPDAAAAPSFPSSSTNATASSPSSPAGRRR